MLDLTEASGPRRGPGRRRTGPAVAISLAVHALILVGVGLIVPHPSFRNYSPDEKPIVVALLPPPELTRPRKPKTTARDAAPAPSQPTPHPLPLPRIHTPPSPPPAAVKPSVIPAPAAPHPGAATAAPKPGTSIAPGPLPAEENPRGVGAMLRRSAGCDYDDVVHLTPDEKEACAKRIGDIRKNAQPFSFIPDAKRGAYSAQAEADERKRAAREGAMSSPVQACDGVGSNMGAGCLNEQYKTKVRVP